MAIMDRGERGYSRRKYSHSGLRMDGAMLPGSAREAAKESIPAAVIPGKLPVLPLRKQAPMILVMSAVIFVFAFTLISQTANCTRAAKDVSTLNAKIHTLRLQNEQLSQEIASLESAVRIEREAQFTLGMVEPPYNLRYVSVPEIIRADEPPVVAADSESWIKTALRALGGV
ncbi:hypothetical protein AGMMS49992_04910 [Clostridia bacterium]|nr:hypothetical protein AGMMS49992_04910 [Clostridia bacterium]